jgi:hypothetical protein
VLESSSGIWIRLDQKVFVPEGDNEGCTLELRYYTLRIRLRDPIAGREIRGHARGSRAKGAVFGQYRIRGDRVVFLVPRVIGLSPSDARHLLRAQEYRARISRTASCGARAQVIDQSPRPHSERRTKVVRLAVRPACG